MGPNCFAVYAPAQAGLPFLSVMLPPQGRIQVEGFQTAAEAQEHNNHAQALIAPKINLRPDSNVPWEIAANVFAMRRATSPEHRSSSPGIASQPNAM